MSLKSSRDLISLGLLSLDALKVTQQNDNLKGLSICFNLNRSEVKIIGRGVYR